MSAGPLADGGAAPPGLRAVAAPCPHAADCGGCAYQSTDLTDLGEWKRARLRQVLARAGLQAEVASTVMSPPHSRRRVKLAAMRSKKRILLGFRAPRSHRVVDVGACLVAAPAIVAALPALRDLAALAAPRARPIGLWASVSEGGLDIAVAEGKPLTPDLISSAAAWAEAADVARLSWNGETVAARRPAWRRHGRALVEPPPAAFWQATAAGEAALVAQTTAHLAGLRRVADLFAGAGAFTLPLAETAEVDAYEGDPGLVSSLVRGWRAARGLKRVTAEKRDLFRRPVRAEELKGVEGAVFDPPRAGAEAQAAQLAAAPLGVSKLVGVSCDPETFARDARILTGGGWTLRRAIPVDQFLWSPHLELVGLFDRD